MRLITRALRPLIVLSLLALASCNRTNGDHLENRKEAVQEKATLVLGGYSIPREAYGKLIIPAFRKKWLSEKKQELEISESYMASGAQARAIVGGFEADVAALSLDPDIQKIGDAGLIRHDWRAKPHGGIVTRSVVVIGVRKGNPKGIHDWRDLAKPGLNVLTPNVKTSGGAMWNVLALYGAALRAGTPEGAELRAQELLLGVLANVKIMDSSGRDSVLNFERGVGDAIITYENEILVLPEEKRPDIIVPRSTILIENPVAVIDTYAKKHGADALAEGFVDFLFSLEAQRAYASQGLRPVDDVALREAGEKFAKVHDLFTIRDLGGWPGVRKLVFAEGALYDQVLLLSRKSGKGS